MSDEKQPLLQTSDRIRQAIPPLKMPHFMSEPMPVLSTTSSSDLNASSALAFSVPRLPSPRVSETQMPPTPQQPSSTAKHFEFSHRLSKSALYSDNDDDFDDTQSSTHSSSTSSAHSDIIHAEKIDRYNQRVECVEIAKHLAAHVHSSPAIIRPTTTTRNRSQKRSLVDTKLPSPRVIFFSKVTGVMTARKFEHLDFTISETWPDYSKASTISSEEYSVDSGNSDTLIASLLNTSGNQASINSISRILSSSPFWIDVLNPSKIEVETFCLLFGIHPLTCEDILSEETREKAEAFPTYVYISIKTFDDDPYSFQYLQAIGVSIVVFQDCILTFHSKPVTHIQSVLQKIDQLKSFDHVDITPEWICYTLIDDLIDSFVPLLQYIQHEVESIDDLVLILKESEKTDMLRRICTARKKVLLLLRLSTTKSTVIKLLIKLFSHDDPSRAEISLYLADIQDHVIALVQNLSHAEKTLSRSYSNYLAQISIEITQASNKVNDVVMRMTALAGLLIPLNVITGLFGMNVKVPGQDRKSLEWFFGIIAFMMLVATCTFWMIRRSKII